MSGELQNRINESARARQKLACTESTARHQLSDARYHRSCRIVSEPRTIANRHVDHFLDGCIQHSVSCMGYHTQLAEMSFDEIFDLTAGVFFFF